MELRYIEHSHGFERSSRHDMALGKRRRREKLKFLEAAEETAPDPRVPDLQALLQKHFEANFEPLPNVHTTENGDASQRFLANDSDTSDWEGISDDEAPYPETISHDQGATATEDICESELKAFMGARPPAVMDVPKPGSRTKEAHESDLEDVVSEAANLRKDLALQRLLKESHLLDPQSTLSVAGRNRHKAIDMRLQDLGSKFSVYTQENMPMAHRKGITRKATQREDARRAEARENGIILEKVVKNKKGREAKRQRALGAPAVGKFRGGMLKLSKRDVAEIQGPRSSTRWRK